MARRRWLTVIIITLFACAGTIVATASTPPRYQSQSSILLTGSKFKVNLGSNITNQDNLAGVQSAAAGSRTDEYTAIVLSSETRELAAQQLGEPIDVTFDVSLRVRGALLTIVVQTDTPERAARMANAYARAAAQRLDTVYGVGDLDQAALRQQLTEATEAQRRAQDRLAEFVRTNRIDAISREIAQKELVIKTILGEQNDAIKGSLSYLYKSLGETAALKSDALVLRQQIEAGGQSSAGAAAQSLALLSLATKTVNLGSYGDATTGGEAKLELSKDGKTTFSSTGGGSSARPGNLAQLNLNVDSLLAGKAGREQLLSDLTVISTALDQREAQYRRELKSLLEKMAAEAGTGSTSLTIPNYEDTQPVARSIVDRLSAEIQALQAESGKLQADEEILTQQVELAKTARASLESKLKEASMSASPAGDKVAVVSTAVAPPFPVFPPPLSRSIPLSLAAGLALGAAVALGLEILTRSAGSPTLPVATGEQESTDALRSSVRLH